MPFSTHEPVARLVLRSARRAAGLPSVLLLALLLPTGSPAQCVEGDCVNGYGTKITRGQKYTGEFVHNHRQGKGTYYFIDGSIYSGDWADGVMQGQGEYRFPNGDVYRGAFKNGHRDGQGTYTFASGETISGLWKGNQLIMEGAGPSDVSPNSPNLSTHATDETSEAHSAVSTESAAPPRNNTDTQPETEAQPAASDQAAPRRIPSAPSSNPPASPADRPDSSWQWPNSSEKPDGMAPSGDEPEEIPL